MHLQSKMHFFDGVFYLQISQWFLENHDSFVKHAVYSLSWMNEVSINLAP